MRQKCLILLKCSIMFLRQQRRTKTWISPRSTLKWFERAIDQGRKSCWNYKYKKVFPPSSLWVAVLINEGTNISGNMEKAGNVVVFPFKGDSLGLRHQTFPSLSSLLHKRHLEYLQIVHEYVCKRHTWFEGTGTCEQNIGLKFMNMCLSTFTITCVCPRRGNTSKRKIHPIIFQLSAPLCSPASLIQEEVFFMTIARKK